MNTKPFVGNLSFNTTENEVDSVAIDLAQHTVRNLEWPGPFLTSGWVLPVFPEGVIPEATLETDR